MAAGSRGSKVQLSGSCSPFAVLILDKRRAEFQLTTASGKNISQPSKSPTVVLGPSGNPGVLQQRYLLGPACSMGVQWFSAEKHPRGSCSHGVREMGKEGRAVVGHGTRGSW